MIILFLLVGAAAAASDEDLHPPRDLLHLFFCKSLVLLASQLTIKHNVNSLIECLVVDYIPVLQRCNDIKLVWNHYGGFRIRVDQIFTALGCIGMVNMGDYLSVNTFVILILHYATDAEKDVKQGPDGLSKMDPNGSPCPRFAKVSFVGSFIREYARKVLLMTETKAREYWESVKEKVLEAIAIVDHRLIISKDKDEFNNELKELATKDHTSVAVLTLLGSINIAFHNLFYHLRTQGRKLGNIVISKSVWDFAYG